MRTYIILPIILCCIFSSNLRASVDEQYSAAMSRLEKRVAKEKRAYEYEKEGKLNEAISIFLEVANEHESSAVASPARNALLRLYEKTDQYDKALEQVEWFLSSNQNEQGRRLSLADKQRLLEKYEVQKRGEKVEESEPMAAERGTQPIKRVSDFYRGDYGSQKAFLEKELPEDTEIRSLGKQAMLAEHAGKFKEAKDFYEKMLLRKDETVAAFGEFGWVMLHPAVQRTSEVTSDEIREKEMLVWIRENIFLDQAPYRKYLKSLLPAVQDHIKERFKKYGLG